MHEKAGLERFIIEPGRRLVVLLAALVLLFTGAARAGGPGGLEAAYAGQGIKGEASLTLGAWPDLSPETLSAMQAWLAFLRLDFYAGEEQSGLRLRDGSRTVVTAQSRQAGDESRLTLSAPGGLAPTTYVGTRDQPPMQALFGTAGIPDFRGLAGGLPRLGAALAAGLVPYEKPQATKTSIKNVGRAESRLNYALSAQEANAWWQAALPQVQAIWAEAAAGLPPDWREAGERAISSLGFTGKLTVRRLLDEAGEDLGFQAAAPIEVLGQRYRLDLTAGFRAGAGFYLSLKLPAARGRDRLEALVSLALSEQAGEARVKGDYSFTRVWEGERYAISGKADLALAGAEHLRGEITAQVQGTAAAKQDHRFVPDFSLKGDELTGSLQWLQSQGKNTLRDMTLALRIAPGAAQGEMSPQARVDLRGAADAARGYAARQAADALIPYLQEKLLTLPQSTRLVVLHDWGRVRRALGEARNLTLPEAQAELFTVVDDTDIQPESKEEIP